MLSLNISAILLSVLALSSTASALKSRADDCSCGYVLSAHNNAYFPKHALADFSVLPDGQLTSATALQSLGFRIADGYAIGGTSSDGTMPIGSYKNLYVRSGVLHLDVPGGQKTGGQVSGAEIDSMETFLFGVFEVDMQLDATPGTCQSMFTFRADGSNHDEQDIENLGATIYHDASNGTPPGVELTNWDPNTANTRDNTIVPSPSDPTTAYHKYTLAWLESGTQYYFDGEALNSPIKYSSKNPSLLILNHWSNGDPGFTQGPPTKQVIMRVKTVEYYYSTATESGLPSGCTLEQACKV